MMSSVMAAPVADFELVKRAAQFEIYGQQARDGAANKFLTDILQQQKDAANKAIADKATQAIVDKAKHDQQIKDQADQKEKNRIYAEKLKQEKLAKEKADQAARDKASQGVVLTKMWSLFDGSRNLYANMQPQSASLDARKYWLAGVFRGALYRELQSQANLKKEPALISFDNMSFYSADGNTAVFPSADNLRVAFNINFIDIPNKYITASGSQKVESFLNDLMSRVH